MKLAVHKPHQLRGVASVPAALVRSFLREVWLAERWRSYDDRWGITFDQTIGGARMGWEQASRD
jgi:hypothetical protein